MARPSLPYLFCLGRDLFAASRSGSGIGQIKADLRHFPDAWSSCSDFSFLAFPMSFGFHAINDGINTYKYS